MKKATKNSRVKNAMMELNIVKKNSSPIKRNFKDTPRFFTITPIMKKATMDKDTKIVNTQ